jgi:hypothetical protein
MLGFLVAVLFSGFVAVMLSFAVYGMVVFSLTCRQKRQNAACCSWTEAWNVVKAQWEQHIAGGEAAVDTSTITPAKPRRPRKTSDTPKAPRTRKPRIQ